MESFELIAQTRATDEKNNQIRQQKMVPWIIYGKTHQPIMVKFDGVEFLKLQRKASGSHIVNIKVDNKSIEVLIHDYQKDPVIGDFTHVDFYAITKGQKVTVSIALTFVGESQAKRDGCILETPLKEIEVECEPKDLVDNFAVNLELLANEGDSIKVEDLWIDAKKYDIITPMTDVVVTAVKVEEEVIDNAAPVSNIVKTEAELAAEKAAAEKKEEKKDK